MASSDGGDRLVWLLVILVATRTVIADTFTHSVQDSVRWATSEFGECSVECGDGVQERTVRCVRTEVWNGESKDTEVPVTSCSEPSPPLTRPCSNDQCTGHWMAGDWSECSETCGTGIQTRVIKCESPLVKNQRYQVAQTHCPGFRPESSRACHVTDCPDIDEEPHILSENYTLIQLNRAKKITVNVGGQVNLFPGQTIEVRCPVKHFSADLIYWSKGYRLVPFMGRVRSIHGGLLIEKANPGIDAGVYTCNAGDLTSAVTVQFTKKDDPLAKKYKKTIRKSKLQHKTSVLKENSGHDNDDGMPPLGPEELNQQRDQSKTSTNFRMYATLDWSPCNATCGAAGQQMREVTCFHVTQKYIKFVPESECSDVGLEKPEAVRECSPEKSCLETGKSAVWRSGPWTQCHPSCGNAGHMSRILTCDWQSTGRPPWEVCDTKSKPVALKSCTPRPCPSACIDDSRYCNLASVLKLCRYNHFRQECCHTCQTLPSS